MSLPRFGVTRPVPVNILMVALLAGGVAAGLTMTREFFPETTPESATVTLPYPGATPQEIEESLAMKVEDKLADIDEVERLTTTIAEGGGGIVVEFRDGIDVTKATDEIEREIAALRDLPQDAERIQVAEFQPRLPVIMVSLFGEADEEALKRAIRDIRDDLNTLPDMGEIILTGVRDYEVRVDVSSAALLEHRLSLPQVSEVIGAWMTDVPGGTVRTNVGNVNVRTMGVAERAEAIRGIVVRATPDGQVIRVADIATVRESYVDEQFKTRFRTRTISGPSASLTVYKVGDQDAVQIAKMVRAYVRGRQLAAGDEEAVFEASWTDRVHGAMNAMRVRPMAERSSRALNWLAGRPAEAYRAPAPLRTTRRAAYDLGAEERTPLPAGCHLTTSSDLARFIEGRLDLLLRNARWGGLLVIGTLLLFLNWRTAWWVAVGLVTALSGTLLFMYVLGITLNLLTMFGLILVLGLLVDDAIVVAENITARHERDEPALVAAIKGTEQVFWPVVATVLTSIVAFLPLTFIRGQIGDLLGMLPWVVACALFMSLVESVVILPSHLGHSFHRRDKRRPGRIGRGLRRVEAWRDRLILDSLVPAYARLLALALRHRYVSLSLALAVLIVTLGMVTGGRTEFTFIPKSDSETLIIELNMPVGTPIERTEGIIRRIEDAAAAQPETHTISTLVGVQAQVDDTTGITAAGIGTHLGQLFVELTPVEQRVEKGQRESSVVIDAIRRDIGLLDGIESIGFSEIQGGPAGKDITIEITGDDKATRDTVIEEVKGLLASKKGVYDIADDEAAGQREVQINLKPGAAALGFTVADVARQVRGALFGLDPHVFSANREDIDVRVRLDEGSRRSLYAIENMWVISPTGMRVPLPEIAELGEGSSYSTIRRVNRRRAVSVTAATAPDVSPETIVAAILPSIRALERKYPAMGIELGGRQRQLRRAFESLPVGFIVALVMIYVILAWLFESYLLPVAVMLAIPFGLVGVVWGHLLLGYELTFLSLIGFVALSGIVVNDSLILVQFFKAKRAEGLALQEALIAAGRQRLRPILLTTITTVLGLTPLMLERSFQAGFLIPMAISISFGLMSATALILMVLPCIIVIIDDLKAVSYHLWNGRPRPVGPHAADPVLQMPED